jgi:bifunctional ADP-heptose synthase (sugar kinase/adenylyltransferase)
MKILVIGESCRDIFVYCRAVRLAPDIPVPVLNVINETENMGMAKNVERNILAKGKSCDIYTNTRWFDITKTRYVHDESNHMFFRVDSEQGVERINLEDLELEKYDIVVISDYNKGFLLESDIENICLSHDTVFLDTKKILGSWARHAKYIKINDYEYNNSKNNLTKELEQKIIHTMGANGCEFLGINFPVEKIEVKDSSGAGDSFMAALVVKYSENQDIVESILYANKCASEVVKHKGVTTI